MSAHQDIINLAAHIYECYCHAVGGKAFNGDPLPSWPEFQNDPKKKLQSDAWIAVANAARNWISGPQ